MKFCTAIVAIVITLFSVSVLAGTTVIEGDEAKTLYKPGEVIELEQKNKAFVFKAPGQAPVEKPKEIKIKVGDQLFITNHEEKFTHNVYDSTDSAWVLKKQKPSEVAAVTFDSPGTHKLRCAIHPKMKVKLIVE